MICLHNLTHRHDKHSQFPSVQRSPLAVHPAQFLKLHAELIIFNLALLIPEQRISIYREVQVAKRFKEDEMLLVLIYRLAELIHDGWFKILVTILRHKLFVFLVNVYGLIRTLFLCMQEVRW